MALPETVTMSNRIVPVVRYPLPAAATYIALAVPAAVLSNSATMRNANCGLSLTPAMPIRLLVFGSKDPAALIVVAVGKSRKLVPLVVYWNRMYLLPLLLSRWSQRTEM